MQYLTILLVIAGVIVLMLGIVAATSYALGAFLSARSGARAGLPADPCSRCEADREWFEELPLWQRNAVTAWWLANRYQCALKGCR